jgi:Zn-dependent protease with chaperone function
MREMPRRGGTASSLLLVTLLLPLAFVLLGFWEQQRGEMDLDALAMLRDHAAQAVATLAARPGPADHGSDTGARLPRDGHGPFALAEARTALAEAEDAFALARLRAALPQVVMTCAGLAAWFSCVALAAAALLGRLGRWSRDVLVDGFTLIRRALPPLLGLQVLLAAAAMVAAIAFETSAILEAGDLSSAGLKLLALAAMVIGLSLWTVGKALFELRRAAGLFTPAPLPILGRAVSRDAAPGLWRLVDDLAARLDALRPDDVVVGLSGGVFVASGPKILDPAGIVLTGRTLYLPLPLLPLLQADEVAAIIGHELAHFAGGDTDYSLRFLPIYTGVGRSLDAVLRAGTRHDGSVALLIRPALRLGGFVLGQFHHAVQHWSRRREFAADAAGAKVTSADAVARTLLRSAAVQPLIDAALTRAFHVPDGAPADLAAAALAEVAGHGPENPANRLEQDQPHPTDTHPATRARLAALGRDATPAMLAEATAAPPPEALSRLSAWFSDPEALCRATTADFLALARQAGAARRMPAAEHSALDFPGRPLAADPWRGFHGERGRP